MIRILLADDSPHAQRMGERILRDEGYEVVTVGEGPAASSALANSQAHVAVIDATLPGRSGYELCRDIKTNPRLSHMRVVLTAGLLEAFDSMLSAQVRADGMLRKPFESSAMLELIRPMVEAAEADRKTPEPMPVLADAPRTSSTGEPADAERERIRTAVAIALNAAMPAMIDHLTAEVLRALRP